MEIIDEEEVEQEKSEVKEWTEVLWLGKMAKSLFNISFLLLLRWSVGNIMWQSQSHRNGHITMESQHVTKKSVDE